MSLITLAIGFVGGVLVTVIVKPVFAWVSTVFSKAKTVVADVKKDV